MSTSTEESNWVRKRVVVRFAGDSGDGMQLTGTRFTEASALAGNDLATFPDFPAEIRAPAGSLGGVSGFQVQFSSEAVFTPGDRPDVLVAMNPAALARNWKTLDESAIIIADADQFTEKNLTRAGYGANPLEDGSLDKFRLHAIPLTTLTMGALDELDMSKREKERCRNFFALGLASWMFGRPLDSSKAWISRRFGESLVAVANLTALQKGYDFGITAEIFAHPIEVAPAAIEPGDYRSITGNVAIALGLATAGALAGRPLVFAGYPITPASDILHELSKLKNYDVRTLQAEDEIAAACMAIGASYGGAVGATASSSPGIALKGEAIGLAVAAELPMIIVNVQRAGPSTGMPTKVEQADLNLSLYGRNGESPSVLLAAAEPTDCFDVAVEAVRISTKYMIPVFVLSDAYVANGAGPWKIPAVEDLPDIRVENASEPEGFLPYKRDPETLARPWAVPGTPGLEHRIGGLEKAYETGHISYDPANHQRMSELRQAKIDRIAQDIPLQEVYGPEGSRVLVVSWGGTYGMVRAAVQELQQRGAKLHHAHLRYLNPMPANMEELLRSYDRVIVTELNMGQLATLIQGRFGIKVESIAKIQGLPFMVSELVAKIGDALGA